MHEAASPVVPVRQQVAVANDNEDAIAAAAAAEQTIVRRSASYTGHTGIKKNPTVLFLDRRNKRNKNSEETTGTG